MDEVSGSSLPTSVSGRITTFPPFICMRDRSYFTALHNVAEENAENLDFLFVFVVVVVFVVVMLVLNQFLPLALSRLTAGRVLKKVNKPARNLRVPANLRDLTRNR